MPVLGCGAQMSKLMDVSDADVAVMEDTIAERIGMGISQAVAQRQGVNEALAQLADERSMVMKAVQEQLGVKDVPEMDFGKTALAMSNKAEDLFPEEFATKKTEGDSGVKVSSKGDTLKGANVNSDGQQITATKQGVTNFWKWFGNSAAVDEDNKPLVLYHSTNADFSAFEPGRETINSTTFGDVETQRHGIFTSPDKKFSQEYLRKGDGQNVMQVYASINSPIDLREGISGEDLNAIVKESDGKLTHRDFSYVDPYESWQFFDDEFGKNFVEAAKAAGFDGAIMFEAGPDGNKPATTYVAFDANQVKSATGNLGTFNPEDPRIAFANKPQTETPQFKDWFGESKVVDADGKPLVVYHGTNDTFNKVNFKKGAQGLFWFASDRAAIESGDAGAQGVGKIMELYAKIENPAGWKEYDNYSTGELLGRGYDGVILPEKDGSFTGFVFKDEAQIKSATGNNGDFSKTDKRIAYANKPRPAPLAEETRWQAFRRTMQDKYIHVEAVQNAILQNGGTIGEQQNVYRAEERMHGRAQEKLIDFGRNLLEPLLEKAVKYGIDLNELAAYAYAKHAEERNAHIDTINPALQGAGSGMDDATAQNIVQMVQLSGDQAKFDELQQDLMKLTEATRQEYLKSGLISQEEYDAWTSMYQDYVPLRGFENVDPEGNAKPGAGSGLSVKGKETIKALGRRSRAGDIIENIVAEHERAVLRGERNRVAKTFLSMVQANPDPNLWEVQPRKIKPAFDRRRNLVVYRRTPDTAESVGAKVAGQQIYIKVKDPLLLRALTNEGLDKKGSLQGTVVETLGLYTNLLRNTLTRYNPVFGAVNAVRDAPMGALSTYDVLGGKGVALYAKYYQQAIMASGRQEWGNPNMAKEMDRWLKEMRLAGGTTSGVYMRDVSEIKSELRTLMLINGAAPDGLREKLIAKSAGAVKGAKAVGKVLEWVGSTSEDAARLSAYRAARELGKTPAEAASIAKNLTTNFNRSGEWGASINGLYLFFNAGVQGSARLGQALKNPRVRYALAAATGAAMAVALAGASGGGEDDDGVPYWDQIPDFEKERNLIIMVPPGIEMAGTETVGKKGRYIKIPVQYGLNTFMVLGYQMADLARNVKDPARGVGPGKAAINMVSATFGSVNPFGGALDLTSPTQVGMALLPTAGDTAMQLMAGVNAFGKPVGPAKGVYDTSPDSETYSASQAGTASQRLASWMNSATGGNEGRSGLIDVMPGTLDNAVRNTAGGLGMFAAAMVNLPIKYWNAPETVTPRDVPYWRNFYGELDSVSEVSKFYDNRAKASEEMENAKREKKLGLDREYTDKELVLQNMGATAEKYTKRMSKIRKEEIEIALDSEMPTGEKLLARKRLSLERAAQARDYNSEFVSEMEAAERKKN